MLKQILSISTIRNDSQGKEGNMHVIYDMEVTSLCLQERGSLSYMYIKKRAAQRGLNGTQRSFPDK